MEGPSPLLSVLMVNWNSRDMTCACLQSIHAQAHKTRFEIILVDNGSRDGSAQAIVQQFPKVRLIAEACNHGFARANNIAAGLARGRYLLLLNTDTLILDRAIDRLMDFACDHPEAMIWGGRTQFADGRLNPTSVWGRITGWSAFCFAFGLRGLFPDSALFNAEGMGGWRRDQARSVDIVSGCFLLISRRLWDQLGGFDPKFFMYGEEADLCARARTLGARPLMTPAAQIIHYGGASAVSHATKIAYVMGARIGLIERHLTGWDQRIARMASLLHVALRAVGFALLAQALPTRFAGRARQWRRAWQQREDWRHGPSPVELAAQA